MEMKIGVIRGDGIGPEIVAQAQKVLEKVCAKYGHKIAYTEILMAAAPSMPAACLLQTRPLKLQRTVMLY
jgi:isocitrate/isopropylmalate dehydrogenase